MGSGGVGAAESRGNKAVMPLKERHRTLRGILVSTGTSHLYGHNVTGIYYARKKLKVDTTIRDINRSLKTDSKAKALELLPQKLVEMREEIARQIASDGEVTFDQCLIDVQKRSLTKTSTAHI